MARHWALLYPMAGFWSSSFRVLLIHFLQSLTVYFSTATFCDILRPRLVQLRRNLLSAHGYVIVTKSQEYGRPVVYLSVR